MKQTIRVMTLATLISIVTFSAFGQATEKSLIEVERKEVNLKFQKQINDAGAFIVAGSFISVLGGFAGSAEGIDPKKGTQITNITKAASGVLFGVAGFKLLSARRYK